MASSLKRRADDASALDGPESKRSWTRGIKTLQQKKVEHATREQIRVRERRQLLNDLISIIPELQVASRCKKPGEKKHKLSTVEILKATFKYVCQLQDEKKGLQGNSSPVAAAGVIDEGLVEVLATVSPPPCVSADDETGVAASGESHSLEVTEVLDKAQVAASAGGSHDSRHGTVSHEKGSISSQSDFAWECCEVMSDSQPSSSPGGRASSQDGETLDIHWLEQFYDKQSHNNGNGGVISLYRDEMPWQGTAGMPFTGQHSPDSGFSLNVHCGGDYPNEEDDDFTVDINIQVKSNELFSLP